MTEALQFVIITGLILIDIVVAPANLWWEAMKGYVSFGYIPPGVDILLFGALVGYSGPGGLRRKRQLLEREARSCAAK